MRATKPRMAALIRWSDTPWRPEWHEVIDGLTTAEAEQVCREARRLGAHTASVLRADAARKLIRNLGGDNRHDT